MEFDDQEDEEDQEEEEEIDLPPGAHKMPTDHHPQGRKPPCRYRECMKNHAVGIGGHAVDGCCEFMPAGPDNTLDALNCAACSCHRNFHRKELSEHENLGSQTLNPYHYFHPHHPQQILSPYYRTPATTGYLHVRPPALALPSTSMAGEEEDVSQNPNPNHPGLSFGRGAVLGSGSGSGKKRFRTSFTAEQKERMLGLAERLGWRIQKDDEGLVQSFCEELGIKRHVLKVWMHNNKHTLATMGLKHTGRKCDVFEVIIRPTTM